MDVHKVRELSFPPIHQAYSWRDSALYGLSLGYGDNPLDPGQLSFVTERDQQAVPSQSVVLGYPGAWLKYPVLGINYAKLLHGGQSLTIHRPLAPEAQIVARHRVVAVDDKGAEKGAILYLEKRIEDEATGEPIATTVATLLLRGDGGCGSFGEAPQAYSFEHGDGPPTASLIIATLPQSALLYRLNGDLNPLHSEPSAALAAGFERPILHGLCTMGLACRAFLELFCGNKAECLSFLSVRFVKPVFPGERIRFDFFESKSGIGFRATVLERELLVLDRGIAHLA